MDISSRNTDDLQDVSLEIPEDWFGYCKEELETIVTTHKRNLQQLSDLKDAVIKSPYLKIKNPIKGECDKIRQNYLNELNKSTDLIKLYKLEYEALVVEEVKLQDEIDRIEKTLKNNQEELNKCNNEYKTAKSKHKAFLTALNIANEVFESRFGMTVNVESRKCSDKFIATVCFNNLGNDLPVKFEIDELQNQIIDFDASSILSEDEEEKLKAVFQESNNNMALICALRNKIFNHEM